jgi:hypothetical protein
MDRQTQETGVVSTEVGLNELARAQALRVEGRPYLLASCARRVPVELRLSPSAVATSLAVEPG